MGTDIYCTFFLFLALFLNFFIVSTHFIFTLTLWSKYCYYSHIAREERTLVSPGEGRNVTLELRLNSSQSPILTVAFTALDVTALDGKE